MPFTFAALIETQQVPSSASKLYEASLVTRIDKLDVANTDTAPHTITLWLVPGGGSDNAASVSTPARAILGGDTWNSTNEPGQVLVPGDAIWAVASAASVLTIRASGILQT